MFGMGTTITFRYIWVILKNPQLILLGTIMQFTIMPLLAFALSIAFQLPKEAMIGMVLVGACPGGTASNVIVYLAKGNVTLSVLITTVSTLLAPLVTPAIVEFTLGESIAIDYREMMMTIMWIVFIPVVGGFVVQKLFKHAVYKAEKILPAVSVLAITLIIAYVMAVNNTMLKDFPFRILFAVITHNVLGLAGGYAVAHFFKLRHRDAKTISIEVGMQNSGLGVALATQFFHASITALPGALFSLWHNLSGILMARWWSGMYRKFKKKELDRLFPKV